MRLGRVDDPEKGERYWIDRASKIGSQKEKEGDASLPFDRLRTTFNISFTIGFQWKKWAEAFNAQKQNKRRKIEKNFSAIITIHDTSALCASCLTFNNKLADC